MTAIQTHFLLIQLCLIAYFIMRNENIGNLAAAVENYNTNIRIAPSESIGMSFAKEAVWFVLYSI